MPRRRNEVLQRRRRVAEYVAGSGAEFHPGGLENAKRRSGLAGTFPIAKLAVA
jgi:hypothetical protein